MEHILSIFTLILGFITSWVISHFEIKKEKEVFLKKSNSMKIEMDSDKAKIEAFEGNNVNQKKEIENLTQKLNNIGTEMALVQEKSTLLESEITKLRKEIASHKRPIITQLEEYLKISFPEKGCESNFLDTEIKVKEIKKNLEDIFLPQLFWDFFKILEFYPDYRKHDPSFGLIELKNVDVKIESQEEGTSERWEPDEIRTTICFQIDLCSFLIKFSEYTCTMPDGFTPWFGNLFLFDSQNKILFQIQLYKPEWDDDQNWIEPEWSVSDIEEFHSGDWMKPLLIIFKKTALDFENYKKDAEIAQKKKKNDQCRVKFDL